MSKPMSEQMQKVAARYEKATGKKFGQKTNADHIRSMTDEELAAELSVNCRWCVYLPLRKCPKECESGVLAWLKQPYGGDT